jgi:hypothetical protein
MPSPFENHRPDSRGSGSEFNLSESQVPEHSDLHEPLRDAAGGLTNDELREIALNSPPSALWFEGDEEQLF